jgi:hypothetical protein
LAINVLDSDVSQRAADRVENGGTHFGPPHTSVKVGTNESDSALALTSLPIGLRAKNVLSLSRIPLAHKHMRVSVCAAIKQTPGANRRATVGARECEAAVKRAKHSGTARTLEIEKALFDVTPMHAQLFVAVQLAAP